jgi:gliding motility-associated protein GldL
MGLSEITQTRGWKNFMAKLYGIGASVVIVGALFKILHLPGANYMLIAGLGTEAIIFFFSAFEPLHEEVDWTLVYPELAGLGENDEIDIRTEKSNTKAVATSNEAMAKFNQMIEKAGAGNIFEKFGDGIQNLNDKVSKMSDISDATLATNEYSANMKTAAETVSSLNNGYKKSFDGITSSMETLAGSYGKSSESINYSAENLSDSLSKVSQKVTASGESFTAAYSKLTSSMEVDFSALKTGNSEYNQNIGKLNTNLAALNAIFELQLEEADLDKMVNDLRGSVEHSKKYNDEMTKLGRQLEALTTVYGNMLTALNVKLS